MPTEENREQREVAVAGFPRLSQRDTASISKLRKKGTGNREQLNSMVL
ncbi:hypothetical protein [Pleurocapsa sp. PCC 7319]|nr:hypothetical protein [Pleurocapsa sp. PCC 7319]